MMNDIEEEERQKMARLLRHLRVTKRAQDGLPAIVLAYTPGRGVLAAVAQPRNPLLARGIIEVVRERQSWRDPAGVPLDALPAVRFQPYDPEQFRTPIPGGRGRRRIANGILTGLASHLVVPNPIGVAAVYVADGKPHFEAAGRTPGIVRLLIGLQPSLAAITSDAEKHNWFRADVGIGDLIDPDERGPLGPAFDTS